MKFLLYVLVAMVIVTVFIPVEEYIVLDDIRSDEKFFCIDGAEKFWRNDYSGVFGRFGNNVMSLFHAIFYARKKNLKVAVLTKGQKEVEILKNGFDDIENVYWNYSKHQIHCEVKLSWSQLFFEKDHIRKHFLEDFKLAPLALKYRIEAEKTMKKYKSEFSIHGRSFEGHCLFSSNHEHTPVPCKNFTHNLCKDYRYDTVTELFGLKGRPILFSDGQSLYNDITYYKPGGYIDNSEFMVQLWMMVISKHHVGEPGSSLDYLVWLWKRQYSKDTIMYPTECYPMVI